MPDPTLKIIARSSLAQVREVIEVCDRETARDIYREVLKLAQKMAQKHEFNIQADRRSVVVK